MGRFVHHESDARCQRYRWLDRRNVYKRDPQREAPRQRPRYSAADAVGILREPDGPGLEGSVRVPEDDSENRQPRSSPAASTKRKVANKKRKKYKSERRIRNLAHLYR